MSDLLKEWVKNNPVRYVTNLPDLSKCPNTKRLVEKARAFLTAHPIEESGFPEDNNNTDSSVVSQKE